MAGPMVTSLPNLQQSIQPQTGNTGANMAVQLPDLSDPTKLAGDYVNTIMQGAQGIGQVQQSITNSTAQTLREISPVYDQIIGAQTNLEYAAQYPDIVKNIMSLVGDKRFNDDVNRAATAAGLTKIQAANTKLALEQQAAQATTAAIAAGMDASGKALTASLQLQGEKRANAAEARAKSNQDWMDTTRKLQTLGANELKVGIKDGRFTEQQVHEETQRRSSLDLTFKNLANAVKVNDMQTANALRADALSKFSLDDYDKYLKEAAAGGGNTTVKTPYGPVNFTARELQAGQLSYMNTLRTNVENANAITARQIETSNVSIDAATALQEANRLYNGAIPPNIIATHKQVLASTYTVDANGQLVPKALNQDTINKLNEDVKKINEQMKQYREAAYTVEQRPTATQWEKTGTVDATNAAVFIGSGVVNKNFVMPHGSNPDQEASAQAWNNIANIFADTADKQHQQFVALQLPKKGEKGAAPDKIALRAEQWENIVQSSVRETNAPAKAQSHFANLAFAETLQSLAQTSPDLFGEFVDSKTGNPSVKYRDPQQGGAVNWNWIMRDMMDKTVRLQQAGNTDAGVNLPENFFTAAGSSNTAQFMQSKYGPKNVHEASVARVVGVQNVAAGLPNQINALRQQMTRILEVEARADQNQHKQIEQAKIMAATGVPEMGMVGGIAPAQPYTPSDRLKRLLGTFAGAQQ